MPQWPTHPPNSKPAAPPPPPDPHYPRYVTVEGADPCRECKERHEWRPGPNGVIQKAMLGPNPDCPFCKGSGKVARRVIAQNHEHHSGLVGIKIGPDGEPVHMLPPSKEEVIKAGYSEEAAAKIAAQEAEKAAKGEPPYGETTPVSAGGQAPLSAGGQDPLGDLDF